MSPKGVRKQKSACGQGAAKATVKPKGVTKPVAAAPAKEDKIQKSIHMKVNVPKCRIVLKDGYTPPCTTCNQTYGQYEKDLMPRKAILKWRSYNENYY